MNSIWSTILNFAALAVLVAGAGAWWVQRRAVANLMKQLRAAETSRREIASEMQALRQHFDDVRSEAAPANDMEERKRALELALDPAPPAAAEFPWLETMPAPEGGSDSKLFAPTQPTGLDLELDVSAKR